MLRARENARSEFALQLNNQLRVVDRTFIEDNIRWIIDYKSVSFEVDTSDLQAHAAFHNTQLAGYAALFAHEKLTIKKAIFYLSLGKLVTLED